MAPRGFRDLEALASRVRGGPLEKMTMIRTRWLAVLGVCFLLSGCPTPGDVHEDRSPDRIDIRLGGDDDSIRLFSDEEEVWKVESRRATRERLLAQEGW